MSGISVTEFAKKFSLNGETVRRWIRRGKLNAQLVDGKYVIFDDEPPTTSDISNTQMQLKISQIEIENNLLKEQITRLENINGQLMNDLKEANQRADTLIEQLNDSRLRSDMLLAQLQEYLTHPWWRRIFWRRKQLPPIIKMQQE